jgi:hypothetical protein
MSDSMLAWYGTYPPGAAPTPGKRIGPDPIARSRTANVGQIDYGARSCTAPAAAGLRYAPGLDGIRALAVAAVVVYHLGTTGGAHPLRGGFLGVDVFFVLSGYLITSLLIVEARQTGRISIRQFYQRRARRLLPALYTLLLAVGAAAQADPTHVRVIEPPGEFCTDPAIASNTKYRWGGVHYYKPGAALYFRAAIPQLLRMV